MKQRWYRTNITKAVLVLLAHIMVVVMTVSILWVSSYPALFAEVLSGNPAREYKDSKDFAERMRTYSTYAVSAIAAKELFETDGKYDPERQVDIKEYYDSGEFTGKEDSGLVYRLGDVLAWYDERNDEESAAEQIIVCKRPDESYQYYLISEFYELLKNNELQFVDIDEEAGLTEENVLRDLEYGYGMPDSMFHGIQDSEGRLVYSDCWLYDGTAYLEKYKPEGAESLLSMVNEQPQWNGKLNEVYNMLNVTIDDLGQKYSSYQAYDETLAEGDTNLSYIYADKKNKKIYTNRKEYENYGNLKQNLEKLKASGKYAVIQPKLADFETNMDIDAESWRSGIKYTGPIQDDFIFAAAIDTDYPVQDAFYKENRLYEKYGSRIRGTIFWGSGALIIFLVCVLWLAVVAGRSSTDEELHLNWFDRWKTGLAAAAVIIMWGFGTLAGAAFGGLVLPSNVVTSVSEAGIVQYDTYLSGTFPHIIWYSVLALYTCCMFLIGFLSLVRRLKAREVWKNSVTRQACRFVYMLFKNINNIWRTVVIFGCFVLIEMFLCILISSNIYGYVSSCFCLFLLLVDVCAFIWLVCQSIGKYKIKKGIEHIAGGEVQYTISLDGLYGEQREIAAMINTIRDGLDAALAESMKSERLKTDLITNVSHDIKTPLTSIINYVELLKQENFEDPRIQRYIEVLEQKSQRLKTLTEDVVEASKVSSGNITLEYMDINFTEMLQQTSGEFEEKFKMRGLKEILSLPGEEAIIRADGRRTWRILENVYNNAAKYAMQGTRVYGDLTVTEQDVCFSLKNMSEQPLNISADELTERFIRGDISRSTEGSGLGLSIAKTLTEMQGGSFELYLDGDLFKVMIRFPRRR